MSYCSNSFRDIAIFSKNGFGYRGTPFSTVNIIKKIFYSYISTDSAQVLKSYKLFFLKFFKH